MKKISEFVLYILLLFGIYSSSSLSSTQLLSGDICPNIAFLPECYIALGCYICLLLAHAFRLKDIFFYTIALIPLFIEIFEVFFQLNGTIQNIGGTSQSFTGLGLIAFVLGVKYLTSRK